MSNVDTISFSRTTAEVISVFDMRAHETTLPSLKAPVSLDARLQMMHSLMSMDSDFVREQDDMLYLRLGQGASYNSSKRDLGMAAGVFLANSKLSSYPSKYEGEIRSLTTRGTYRRSSRDHFSCGNRV